MRYTEADYCHELNPNRIEMTRALSSCEKVVSGWDWHIKLLMEISNEQRKVFMKKALLYTYMHFAHKLCTAL